MVTGAKPRTAPVPEEESLPSLCRSGMSMRYTTLRSLSASSLWRHSFTPLGPCLTLKPPSSASQYSLSVSIKFREKLADMDPCQRIEGEHSGRYSDSEDCTTERRHCNTTCAWQRFLEDFEVLICDNDTIKRLLANASHTAYWMVDCLRDNVCPPAHNESLVVERMASRVLGCRPSSTARLDECVKCLLQHGEDAILPFISVNDLPLCAPKHLTVPRLRFTVHKDYVKRIASMEMSCPTCVHLNDSRPSNLVKYVINEDSAALFINGVCALGGVVGLYLGLSLLNFADLLKKSSVKQHLKAGGRCLVVVWLVFTGGVVVAMVAICLLLLHTFLGEHPVYTSTFMHALEEELPSITTCVWPPVNIQRLLDTAGLGAAFADVALKKDPEERHAAISLLLHKLPQSSNITDPAVLWHAGAWTPNEIYGLLLLERDEESSKGHIHALPHRTLASWNTATEYLPTFSRPKQDQVVPSSLQSYKSNLLQVQNRRHGKISIIRNRSGN
ncbi:hypothetical protein O3P69_014032 [Scylla paramamosain]|uniref:Transmembrane protein n=1 Tax=Scylla paramamosain TaxID=85552 RepID=A0AAW0SSU5_SCYPA